MGFFYHPFMVILGMVYYCLNHIRWVARPHVRQHAAADPPLRDKHQIQRSGSLDHLGRLGMARQSITRWNELRFQPRHYVKEFQQQTRESFLLTCLPKGCKILQSHFRVPVPNSILATGLGYCPFSHMFAVQYTTIFLCRTPWKNGGFLIVLTPKAQTKSCENDINKDEKEGQLSGVNRFTFLTATAWRLHHVGFVQCSVMDGKRVGAGAFEGFEEGFDSKFTADMTIDDE